MKMWNKFLSKRYRKKGYTGKYLKLRVTEFNKNLGKAFIIFTLFFVGVTILIYSPYADEVKDKMINMYFRGVIGIYKSDTIMDSIAEICNSLYEEEKQIRCVNNFVKEFFYYDEHLNETKVLRTPSEIINQGGCCRDYTIFYKVIFDKMGYESEFIHKPTHIYLRVFGEEANYIIDQRDIEIEEKVK